MPKACGSCVYFNLPDTTCRHSFPIPQLSGSPAVVWPRVDPVNDWCSEGWNSADGSYDPRPISTSSFPIKPGSKI